MATDVERLVVLLEANAENLRRQMRGGERVVDRSTRNMERRLQGLRNAFYAVTAALAGGGLIAGTVRLADAYRGLDNRLRLVTDTEDERRDLLRSLLELSNETRTSLEGTTTVYFRLSRGLERYGIQGQRLLGILRTINQTVAISGATAAEAEGALIQFSQALNTDFQSAGQEIRSLQEQMPALVSAIEDGMGIARGSFVQMARAGEISTEQVIEAIERVSGAIDAEFGQTDSTVGQAFKNLNDSILAAVGTFDQASGASSGFADAIDDLADRINENLPFFERLGAALAPTAAAMSGVISGMSGLPGMGSPSGGGGGWGEPQSGAGAAITPPAPGTPSNEDIQQTSTFLALHRDITAELERQAAADAALKELIEQRTEKEQALLDTVKELAMKEDEAAQRMQENLQRTIDGFIGAIEGAKNFEDALKRVVLQMIRMALLSDTGQSFLSNLFSNTIGSFFGGGSSVPGKAIGGPIAGGKAYMVGERGPELFVPRMGGSIVPNGGGVGGMSISFNVDARGAQVGVADQIRAMFPQMVRQIKAEIRNDASRGGAFASALGRA